MFARWLKRYQTPLLVLTVVLLPLLVYRANALDPADTNLIDRLVLAVTSPLKRLMSGVTGAMSDAWYGYVDVVEARSENSDLRRRLRVAELERDRFSIFAQENEHLRSLLHIKERNPKLNPLAATVIAAGTSPLSRTLELDRGLIDGVRRGMPVLASHGLVGLIQRASWTSSEVILIADERVSLQVLVVRSRARGRVQGQGLLPAFSLTLTEVLRSDDIAVGDRIVTSGLGRLFPYGVPVGEVKSIRTVKGGQYRTAEVDPVVDFARLEHVSILLGEPAEEILATPERLLPSSLKPSSDVGTRASTASTAPGR